MSSYRARTHEVSETKPSPSGAQAQQQRIAFGLLAAGEAASERYERQSNRSELSTEYVASGVLFGGRGIYIRTALPPKT